MPIDKPPTPQHDDPEQEEREAAGRRKSLIALAVLTLLLVGGVLLTHELRKTSQLQDCLMMTKAANCARIDTPQADQH